MCLSLIGALLTSKGLLNINNVARRCLHKPIPIPESAKYVRPTHTIMTTIAFTVSPRDSFHLTPHGIKGSPRGNIPEPPVADQLQTPPSSSNPQSGNLKRTRNHDSWPTRVLPAMKPASSLQGRIYCPQQSSRAERRPAAASAPPIPSR